MSSLAFGSAATWGRAAAVENSLPVGDHRPEERPPWAREAQSEAEPSFDD